MEETNLTTQTAQPFSGSEFSLGLKAREPTPPPNPCPHPRREKYIIDEQSLSDLKGQRYKGEPDAWLRTDTSRDIRGSYIISLLMALYIL